MYFRLKLDYGCFFAGSYDPTYYNLLDNIQFSCLVTILEVLKPTPPTLRLWSKRDDKLKTLIVNGLQPDFSSKSSRIFLNFSSISQFSTPSWSLHLLCTNVRYVRYVPKYTFSFLQHPTFPPNYNYILL